MSDNKFNLQINLTKAYVDEDDANFAFIEGIASGPEVDLTGERMSVEALKSMVECFKRKIIELRDAHKTEWNDDLGELVDLYLTDDNHLAYKSRIDLNLSGSKDLFYRMTVLGKKYGVSVGGSVLKAGFEYVAELGRQVYTYFDVELNEISVTRQAAYQYSFANAVLKSLPKGTVMPEEQKQAEATKTEAEETTTETQTDETTKQEAVAAEEQSDATVTTTESQEAETKEVQEEAAADADAEAQATEESAEVEGGVEKSTAADTAIHEVAKSAVLGSWAEADVAWESIDSIAWNLKWYAWDVIANDDMEASEKDAAIAAALAEFSRIVQAVASALTANAPDAETRKAIESLRENAPEAVSKSLTDTQAKVEELTKSLDAKTKEVEVAQKELDDVKKSLAEKETELAKREGRKAIVFGKFDGVDLVKAAPQPQTKSPTLSRWMNS